MYLPVVSHGSSVPSNRTDERATPAESKLISNGNQNGDFAVCAFAYRRGGDGQAGRHRHRHGYITSAPNHIGAWPTGGDPYAAARKGGSHRVEKCVYQFLLSILWPPLGRVRFDSGGVDPTFGFTSKHGSASRTGRELVHLNLSTNVLQTCHGLFLQGPKPYTMSHKNLR